ncbi:MAG: VOC family protein [Betaproteobacteria bacterium]|nr:VOC family protein [Betaproteobacteria bacterium]
MADKPAIGTFCWNELMTADAARAKAFYAALFGWKMSDMPMGADVYTVLKQGDKDIGGLMQIRTDMGPIPSHWLAYVEVTDVDKATAKAGELGGRVHLAGMDVPGIGRFGIFEDPTGAKLAVFRRAQPAAAAKPAKRAKKPKTAKRGTPKAAKKGRRR